MLNTNIENKKLSHAKHQTLIEIPVDAIVNNPQQPRIHINDEELNELAMSIEQLGLIQPIVVVKENDKYILQAGQRRWLAHKKLELDTIQTIVHDELNEDDIKKNRSLFEVAIIENTQRENLNPLELAISFQNALDTKLYSNNATLSKAVGKSPSYVGKVLKILSLAPRIIQDLREHQSINDVEILYELQKISDRERQVQIYFDVINKKIDRKGVRKLVKEEKNPNEKPFRFTGRSKMLKLEFDSTKLTDEEIEKIKLEITEILQRYLS